MTAWSALFLAGLCEVAWALGLKWSDGLTKPWPTLATIACLALSFVLLAISLQSISFGTAYAIWTGIGAAGAVVLGVVLFGEPADLIRVSSVLLIITGIVGLRLSAQLP